MLALVALRSVAGARRARPRSRRLPRSSADIVVTTAVLGAVVRDLVGDRATVSVLMGDGVDPHEWSPSAQDIEALHHADLVVANGLGLEAAIDERARRGRGERRARVPGDGPHHARA